jgi:hypothetical protein
MRQVAIIGGGVAGASAARQIALSLPDQIDAVTVYEIGRGPGGRAATRRTRAVPDFRVNHGAPYADITTAEGRSIVASLGTAVAPYTGDRVVIDAGSGERAARPQARGEMLVTGANGEMANIAEGLLRDTNGEVLSPITRRFSHMVRGLSRPAGRAGQWRLTDKDGETLGEADWLVVAGSGVAHPRWSTTFGGEPPLVAAAQDRSDQRLDDALAVIAEQTAAPVLTVFFYCTGEAAAAWLALGFNDGFVEGDGVLSKVSIQPVGETGCSVVLHSTTSYAQDNAGVYGASSSAARVGDASSSADREGEIINEMLAATAAIPGLPTVEVEALAVGPLMHRWGNAFPAGPLLPASLAVCPASGVAFCGDYVETAARTGSLESALLAGAHVAELIRESG